MGSVIFSAYTDLVAVEICAEGDPYGHDGCDNKNCCWSPDSGETLYLELPAAKELRKQLDAAIKCAQK